MIKEDLIKNGVMDWSYYADSFDLCNILIGNEFSVNLCSRLSYRSLYEKFSFGTSEELRVVFEDLDTTNFELVLETLEITKKINNLYGKDYDFLNPIIKELKNGLISVIVANSSRV